MDIEMQTLPKRDDSTRSEDECVPRPENGSPSSRMEEGGNSQLPEDSQRPKHEVTQRTVSDSSEQSRKGGSQKPQDMYGPCPPRCSMSDAELTQWLMEAEREDRRRYLAEHGGEDSEKLKIKLSRDRWLNNVGRSALRHRGCSFRLPVSEPIPIKQFRYDPSNWLWVRQNERRQRSRVEKKVPKKMVAEVTDVMDVECLVEAGFVFNFQNDTEQWCDYDSDEDFYDENGKLLCPICDRNPKSNDKDLEIAVDVTPPGDATAATIIATDTSTIISCSTAAPSTQVSKIAAKIYNLVKPLWRK